MCKTCDDGICTNRCATQTTVTKVTKITPPPVEGAVGDEAICTFPKCRCPFDLTPDMQCVNNKVMPCNK